MDALEGLSDGDDDSSSSSSSGSDDEGGSGSGGEGAAGGAAQAGKKQKRADGTAAPAGGTSKKKVITLDDLEAQGFTTGPSVLFLKAPEENTQDWSWCVEGGGLAYLEGGVGMGGKGAAGAAYATFRATYGNINASGMTLDHEPHS